MEEVETKEPNLTNESLVEEAWEVVNQSFLPDAGTRPWSPELWLVGFELLFALAFHQAPSGHYYYAFQSVQILWIGLKQVTKLM